MTALALQVSGLTKRFSDGSRSILAAADVSLEIMPGETLALAGPSGSGKSTVARLVMRLLDADAGLITVGDSKVSALHGNELRRARRKFQMVFQDTTGSFNPRTSVGRALDDPLRIHAVAPRAERPAVIADLLQQVGLLPDLANRAIHEISGGQRQRVALARVLALKPSLIVLDEALSAIDSSLRGEIAQLLVDLQRKYGMAYLFISHDLALVRAMAHRISVMDAGRIVETGDAVAVIDAPQSAVAKALVAAVPQLKWKASP